MHRHARRTILRRRNWLSSEAKYVAGTGHDCTPIRPEIWSIEDCRFTVLAHSSNFPISSDELLNLTPTVYQAKKPARKSMVARYWDRTSGPLPCELSPPFGKRLAKRSSPTKVL
jgi:hypothetical protein